MVDLKTIFSVTKLQKSIRIKSKAEEDVEDVLMI